MRHDNVMSKDRRELYFIRADKKKMADEIKPGPKFEAGVAKPLFPMRLAAGGDNFYVSKDGRFLSPTPVQEAAAAPITVVLNWPAALKK
jgi:hypothetical protein